MKMAKSWLIIVWALLASSFLFGQSNELYRPNFSVKYNPLAFLAYTSGIELGIERAIRPDASIHLGASYLNDFGIFPDRNFSGYKLISEYRFYSPISKDPNNKFIALRFNFKKVIANGRTYLDRANGNYQELIDLTVDNTTLEFLGVFGKVYPLNTWLSLDLSVVAGAKRLSLSSDDIPDDAFINLTEPLLFNVIPNAPGDYWYPVFRLQAKFNFEFNPSQ